MQYFFELTKEIFNFDVTLTCLTPFMHVNSSRAQKDSQDMKGRVLWVKMKIEHQHILVIMILGRSKSIHR